MKTKYLNIQKMKKNHRPPILQCWRIASLLCSCLLLLSLTAFSQNAKRKITGKVIGDTDSKPMQSVSVLIKGSTVGTSTNDKGEFTILAADKDVLVFSFVGYDPQEITVGKKTSIVVKIEETAASKLTDVVVIGYGTARRKDVTGSVSSLSAEEIVKTQPTTIDQALQGKVAGVVVQQVSGQPGGGVSVQIRGLSSFGNNPPLYVIDGIQIPPNSQSAIDGNGSNPLSSINPSEVASIDILKDASATAIYGSQGTNGVVIITTKRGKVGPPKSYDMYLGQQKLPKYYDVMNLREYAQFLNDKTFDTGDRRPQFANPQYLGEGTNWQKALFRSAPMQNHTIGVAGGDTRTQYFLSGTYFSQDGIALGSDFKRFSLRLNLDNKTTDWLKIGTSLQLANVKENLGSSANSNEVIRTALNQTPDVNITNPNGSYGGNDPNIYGAYSFNPYALALLRTDVRKRYQVFAKCLR
jgi:TonB-dependent starch-binding outer membrane protein SusC